ncbi:hypothetical protein COCMIDRAFT_111148, partial [Bipolaris oryzae ATCC 44560]
ISSLIYLIISTRPNLVFSINYLIRYISNLSLKCYKYPNNIFLYLLTTKDYSLDLTL